MTFKTADVALELQYRFELSKRIEPKLSYVSKKQVIDNTIDICFVKDHLGRMVALSPVYTEYFGVDYEDYIGKFDWEIWGEEGHDFADDDLWVRRTKRASIFKETWTNKLNGQLEEGFVIKIPNKLKGSDEVGTFGIIPKGLIRTINVGYKK